MLFRFVKNPDGSYDILTHASKEACLVEIADASIASGGNVQQWNPNGNNCQKWNAETFTTPAVTTVVTTTTTTATTAATTTNEATTTSTVVTTVVTTAVTTTTTDVVDIIGDVNEDGAFDITDLVLLQKWLLAVSGTKLANWKAADMNNDGKLNVFDLCLMKRELIKTNN